MHDPVTIAAAGFGLGFLHSLEPDHLAAISTLVGRAPQQARKELYKGAAWAAGHVMSLGAFGAAALFLASSRLSTATRPLEMAVGVALVYLGWVRLRDARRGPHQHRHAHRGLEHTHVHLHPARSSEHSGDAHAQHGHAPLWLGILHGLAGTGGLLVVVPALVTESAASYVAYLAAFGLGSMISMAAFCFLLARIGFGLRARSGRAGAWFSAATGSLSLCVGTFWLATAMLP